VGKPVGEDELGDVGLGLWDPAVGSWNVMWSPLSSTTIETHDFRCAFPAGTAYCPGGSAGQTISVPFGEPRNGAFALADMVGDGKPEICTLAHEGMTVRCATSDSGYTTFIERSFGLTGGEFL
jgi:hypothetical protein